MMLCVTLFLFFSPTSYSAAYKINLTDIQLQQLSALIWKNEGQQKVEHLTTWNKNEDFPSLGTGHFIWYPSAKKGPFKEQFPQLLQFMSEQGVQLPQWLAQTDVAPWSSREQFYKEFNESKLTELRHLLSQQLTLQARFIIKRLERAIPAILQSSNAAQKRHIEQALNSLLTSQGIFALLDYVNFKGEGLSVNERYKDQGWGLKQVLLAMVFSKTEENHPLQSPLHHFGNAADKILTRRVNNAPRDESQWLAGWRKRVHAYQRLNTK